MRLTFATKFTLLVILAVILTAVIIGSSLVSVNVVALKNASRGLYQTVALNVSDRLLRIVENAAVLLRQSASAFGNPHLDERSAVRAVSEALAASNDVESIGAYGLDGSLIDVLTKGRAHSLPARIPPDLLRAADTTQADVFAAAPRRFAAPSGGQTLPVIPVLARVRAANAPNGRPSMLLLAVVENESLCALVFDLASRTASGVQGYIVDDSLRLAAHFDPSRLRQPESLAGKGIFAAIAPAPAEQGKVAQSWLRSEIVGVTIEYANPDGERMLGTLMSVPSLRSGIVVEQTQSVAYASVRAMQKRVVMWTLLSALSGVALSLLIARQFSKPIRQLGQHSEQLAAQNFSARLPERRSDELGALFAVQNRVAEEMERYQKLNINRVISERNKLEAVVRQASDGVLIADGAQTVLMLNDKIADWFELAAHNVEGRSLAEAFAQPYEPCQALKTKLLEAFASDEQSLTVEFRLSRSGEVRETVLRGAMVKVTVKKVTVKSASRSAAERGELVAVATMLHDVTKEVEIDRMKTELVSVVAHELRSPLHSIIGMSELIEEGELAAEDAADFGRRITAQARQLNAVITKFLDLNRIESGKAEIRAIPFKLNEVLESALKVNMRLAEKKGITIAVKTPQKIAPVVGDPELIGHVIVNLFSNAVKYSDAGTGIIIEIVESKDKISLRIQDQGYGIAESAKAKLFTKFFRSTDDERVRANTGTGLGLAFAKEIIDKHGGEIGVESRLNAGSTFWFSLSK